MMNSTTPPTKKSALCRYFVNSGSCFYGNDCQFVHDANIGLATGAQPQSQRNTSTSNHAVDHHAVDHHAVDHHAVDHYAIDHINDNSVCAGPAGDANNGDQFFNATFSAPGSITNGSPSEFQHQFITTQKVCGQTSTQHADKALLVASRPAPAVDAQFSNLAVSGKQSPQRKPPNFRGHTAGVCEFLPKVSPAVSGLTHSASSPSFGAFNAHQQLSSVVSCSAATVITGTASPKQQLSQGVSVAMSGRRSSPSCSPLGSPLASRINDSPVVFTVDDTNTSTNNSSAQTMEESVGGTTYFYTQDEMGSPHHSLVMPNFTLYPGVLPHMAHMRRKTNMPSFFMQDELKIEILKRQALSIAQPSEKVSQELPEEVDAYHYLCPLEPPHASPQHKSNTFGYQTTVYKASNSKDGLIYCLHRIHGFRLMNAKCMALIDLWKKIQHSNIVQLREVFTTKAFDDNSMVFVYDYHPCSATLMERHFCQAATIATQNKYASVTSCNGPDNMTESTSSKGVSQTVAAGSQQAAALLPESLIWAYVVQLSSALRTIHAHSLACRVMDPTKILLTDKSRIRLNCIGIFDVISFDNNQTNPLATMPQYQQEDLISLGKVVLALACNSVTGIQQQHIPTSLELVSRNYSADLKNLILYLLTDQNRIRSVNDIMPMIGARFYTQLDASQLRSDVLEHELSKEVESGRLFRLISKLGAINERPEFSLDPSWSETGDRYMLKLFRDYLFHQVDDDGAAWVDMAHVVQCLNKLDAGISEKICLMSRDEQNVLIVSYAQLKQCYESVFTELIEINNSNSQTT